MAPQYEAVPLQVPLPQLSKQEFELKIEGVDLIDRSPLQGYLGIEPCTWPVIAVFTPTKGSIDIRWIELKVQVYERAYTTHIADVEEVSQVLFQSTAVVLGTEENPSYETISEPRTLSHIFNVPSHMPSALQSKHKRAQVIWKLVFKVYRKSGAFKREYIAHEAKFPGIRSYLPIPSSEHEAPLVIRGDSPKGDISWLLRFSRSLYAPGDTARGSLVLTAKPGRSIKSQLRSAQLELTEYVVASGEPDVLLDTLYRNKIDTSGSVVKNEEGCTFDFDVVIPNKSSPDYTGTFMSVTHRFQLTTSWKGRLLDKITSHPVAIAALSHAERQRATEEVAQIETAPSIAPPFRSDDVSPPSYTSTQHLLNGSSTTLMPYRMEDELSSISIPV
ncbi:hypothetical protein RSOLAG1IB_03736 [Rhizoctonia solani AG-1 IB]|uniref:Arrestin-like N-terminal domain-containing protein n=1 Tax=Thanatephorus cucumeris (strain AG1-IB / isolate 7/3/14) TaxID=1108050 RepID=A0A0B7FUE3_THACB|nr:hypothetical protein RSOLAG1IB_03736 [Rhizoctonia solani AG-1 IB]